jgi:hypothetical protein
MMLLLVIGHLEKMGSELSSIIEYFSKLTRFHWPLGSRSLLLLIDSTVRGSNGGCGYFSAHTSTVCCHSIHRWKGQLWLQGSRRVNRLRVVAAEILDTVPVL